jgi:hypothetical protein
MSKIQEFNEIIKEIKLSQIERVKSHDLSQFKKFHGEFLNVAINSGNDAMVLELLKSGVDPNISLIKDFDDQDDSESTSLLEYYLTEENYTMAQEVTNHGFDLTKKDFLSEAVYYNFPFGAVKFLLGHSKNIKKALKESFLRSNLKYIKEFSKHPEFPEIIKNSPDIVFYFIKNWSSFDNLKDCLKILKIIDSTGFDFNSLDSDGNNLSYYIFINHEFNDLKKFETIKDFLEDKNISLKELLLKKNYNNLSGLDNILFNCFKSLVFPIISSVYDLCKNNIDEVYKKQYETIKIFNSLIYQNSDYQVFLYFYENFDGWFYKFSKFSKEIIKDKTIFSYLIRLDYFDSLEEFLKTLKSLNKLDDFFNNEEILADIEFTLLDDKVFKKTSIKILRKFGYDR